MTTAQQPENKKQPNRTVAELVEYIQVLSIEIQELYCLDQIPWVVGYSGGKDSTATLQLIWNAIAELPPEKRTKPIHVITTDTGVENPYVSGWVRSSHKHIELAAQEQKIPMQPHVLEPEIADTYWVGLIGKGYPAPRRKFRWCTGRLKINPSNRFIRDVVRSNGEAIVILGIRKAESHSRATTMKKLEEKRVRERLSPNANLPNSLVYSPIEDWRTDEVWLYLMQWENPWGHSNKDLFTMYRESTADNECPLVVDTSTPSCGSSRFGCWVCTLVDRDKSLNAMIQNNDEKEWLQPIVDFRRELDIENDREKRDFRRLRGEVQLFERNLEGGTSIEPIPGPYTKYWREYWLRKLLIAQKEMRQNAPENMRDITLISQAELSEIRRIWLEEKHEFDDSLPRIYEEVTGEVFKDPRPGADHTTLGIDEWEILEEICDSDGMHLELMSKLLDTERQFKKKTRRVGIYESLEKCFNTSSRSPEAAIKNAHLKRDLRQAALDGDVATIREKVKQLTLGDAPEKEEAKPQTWASFKFAKKNVDDSSDE
ncbi:DNA phosphorothioation system sulfurtransferase DndC [Anabaena cylindrica FACHB-243]|uniref:Sulfurtransferase DndC n=1 Tax=Anabaena cylindrica (strain ATCC 27899 / PCC 7122) TaxID=272123 RepID=K9ZLZ1_ANACC|nr:MULTISPECIES: DNA phosphorothioation system sulfurtransferase DndC [Anabaena]AFZ60201.1 sulfurtransferase DndC [Anabaena cylindrica PCC 7122]MBD2417746.1 DNA phosphorothioation system sulfurtransferase DndC [Anabaena cylindrica FACHB-243]MBY5282624.1 DNA phosphorothioation system sulfurtransferase DndC [Anabaena sp. CCAP 1446/1C]MBY5310486.1 DNA phosphorothioation system sulfurtransferase DndC [Anabaena sp. CCAP 1446/1C]MCM2404661.1 DNA phosphorothioation system sulfurtransferase DndC [Anab